MYIIQVHKTGNAIDFKEVNQNVQRLTLAVPLFLFFNIFYNEHLWLLQGQKSTI